MMTAEEKLKKLQVGKLYVTTKEVLNPGGDKVVGWHKPIEKLHRMPKGILLKVLDRPTVLWSLHVDDPVSTRSEEVGVPYALQVVESFNVVVNAAHNRRQNVRGGALIHMSGASTQPAKHEAWLSAVIDSLTEHQLTHEDQFREAGFPLFDRYNNRFSNVVAWAACKGLIPLEQVKAWAEEEHREATERRR
jgi:hypothetical protein